MQYYLPENKNNKSDNSLFIYLSIMLTIFTNGKLI